MTARDAQYLLDENYVLSRDQLTRNGQHHHLEPRPFALLHCLVENWPHVVTRDELLGELWKGTHGKRDRVDQAVTRLRVALPELRSFIQTVPTKGYRYTGRVKVQHDRVDAANARTNLDAATASGIPKNEQVYVYGPRYMQRQRKINDEKSFIGRLEDGMISPGLPYRSDAIGPVVMAGVPALPGWNDTEVGHFFFELLRLIKAAGWPVKDSFARLDPSTDELFGLTLRYFAKRVEDVPLHLRSLRYALAKDGIPVRLEFIHSSSPRREVFVLVGALPRF